MWLPPYPRHEQKNLIYGHVVRVRVGVSTGRCWLSVLMPVFMQPSYTRAGSSAPACDVAAGVCDVAVAAPVPPA